MFILSSLLYSAPSSHPVTFLHFVFLSLPLIFSYDILRAKITIKDIKMCNFPLFLLIENLRNALLGTFTNVSASPPLSSTSTDTKCQHLSSVTVFANCSHLEMSMGKP